MVAHLPRSLLREQPECFPAMGNTNSSKIDGGGRHFPNGAGRGLFQMVPGSDPGSPQCSCRMGTRLESYVYPSSPRIRKRQSVSRVIVKPEHGTLNRRSCQVFKRSCLDF